MITNNPYRAATRPEFSSGPRRWLMMVGFIGLAQLAGVVGIPFTERGTESWYDSLDKAPFNPPSWVFAPVWTLLYSLIGIAAWLVWRHVSSPERTTALRWWGVQLALNALWTPLFFGAEAPELALAEIVLLLAAVVLTVRSFLRVDELAAWLLVPYLMWVAFAASLNAWIAVAN